MNFIRITSVLICALCLVGSIILIGCSDDEDKGTGPTGGWAWKPLNEGINGPAYAMQEYNGRLFVGGDFTEAGGATINYIASWTGSAWVPLGSGTSWPVHALTVYDNKLIVGGAFSTAGGMIVNSIAAYDGVVWSKLGDGFVGDFGVYDLCVLRDTLFAVGAHGMGGDAVLFVAAWDGSTWDMINPGPPGVARETCVYEDKLVVGGQLIVDQYYDPFAKIMSGGIWYDLDSTSLPGYLYDLTETTDGLFMGGISVHPVKQFSVSWHNVGSEPFGNDGNAASVLTLGELDGKLIAGGRFTTIGNDTVNHIAQWNGASWLPVGDGITGGNEVSRIAVWQNRLYVSGDFTEIGGMAANNIAVWSYEE